MTEIRQDSEIKQISFVIPCYRSEKTIAKVTEEIISAVNAAPGYDYEIIAVNDCSPDGVLEVLRKLAAENPKIKVISFAKNMGKDAAILAGYKVARGEYVINLDDDGQCPACEFRKLLEPLERDECDCATAEYKTKKESLFKRLGSRVNAEMAHMMLDLPKNTRMENFTAVKAFVVREVISYRNPYPYLDGLILRVTNRIKSVPMEEREREDGNGSGFTLRKSIHMFLNGMTAFSVKPLRVASVCGMIFAALGLIYGLITVISYFVDPSVPEGYSSLMAVILFSSGLIMLMLGIAGEYLGRIYICLNDSPQYVIRETINLEKEEGLSDRPSSLPSVGN